MLEEPLIDRKLVRSGFPANSMLRLISTTLMKRLLNKLSPRRLI